MAPTTEQTTTLDAQIRNIPELKRLLRTAAATTDEAQVTVDSDGIHINGASPDMTQLIHVTVKPDAFYSYHAPPSPVTFGSNLTQWSHHVGDAHRDTDLHLAIPQDADRAPTVTVTIDDHGFRTTSTIPTIDLTDEPPEIDDLEYSGEAVIALPQLKDAIQRLGPTADITLHQDRLELVDAQDDHTGHVEFVDGSDYIHGITLDPDCNSVSSTYALDRLATITKLHHTVDHPRLKFGNDFPLLITADRRRFTIDYALAPRIDEP